MRTCNSKVTATEIIVIILSTLSIQQREVTIPLSTLFIAYTYFIQYLMSMLVQRGNIFFLYDGTSRERYNYCTTFRVQLLMTLKTLFFPNANPVILST